ncbi:response regulator transcription factor [Amycolatopsis pithecellobii]|nr:response regulator transcription factor [Amycolatopsis pithecellobii]
MLVQGDPSTARSLAAGLPRHGYRLDEAGTCSDALAARYAPDLVIVDLDQSVHNGLEVCRQMSVGEVPIIALSGRRTETTRVLGLQAGADDCMDKPFGIRELIARIEAVLRRCHSRSPDRRMTLPGALSMDRHMREVRLGGRILDLTGKEFELLWLLASRSGAVVSREEIMAKVWDDTWNRRGRVIDTYVSSVRGKLGHRAWITTVRGVGFRFGL